MVMNYYGVEVDSDELMEKLGTSEEGTPPQGMIVVAQNYGFEIKSGSHWSLNQVKQYVDAGTPVIVLLQAWAEQYDP